ncbi:MAG: thioredoxin [Candidatus Lokiarchaeota archaeon]|nr:thioredoxin [Candidatus Lokiarchaeota archaeon]MBD3199832.1 thioredoxin [Candidatus Lokiarchaeota archaeon]
MPQGIVDLHTPTDFQNLINEYSDKIIVIDFSATWCGPCKAFAPIFETLQKEYSKNFIFGKVDVDENPSTAQKYKISGVPTTIFIKNGKLLNKVVGASNYNAMKNILEKFKSQYN